MFTGAFFSTSMESYLQFHVGSVRTVLCMSVQIRTTCSDFINRLPELAKSTQCVRELESLLNFQRFCARPVTRWPRLSVTQPLVQQPGFPSQSLKERLVRDSVGLE